jgi:hypothetical protein
MCAQMRATQARFLDGTQIIRAGREKIIEASARAADAPLCSAAQRLGPTKTTHARDSAQGTVEVEVLAPKAAAKRVLTVFLFK